MSDATRQDHHAAEAQHVSAETVRLEGGSAYVIKAGKTEMKQSAASTIYAETVDLRESAVGWAESELIRADLAALGVTRAETVAADQSLVGVVRARQAAITNSVAGVAVADRLEANHARAFFLYAREMNGTAYTLLDTRGAALFGLLAGLALGLVWLIGGMFNRRS